MKKSLIKICLLLVLTPLLCVTPAVGAVIIWDTPITVNVNDASQVSTAGTFFAAESVYGNQASIPLTVNGVTFTNTSAIDIQYQAYQQNGSISSGIDYQTLLAGGEYVGNGNAATDLMKIQISGLSSGQNYQVQIWTTYWTGQYPTRFSNNIPSYASDSHATPESDLLTQGVSGTSPQYILGTFTASGTTQSIYYYGSNNYGLIGAIQLRAVPEPQTWTLAGLGAIAVCFRLRCKSRQRQLPI